MLTISIFYYIITGELSYYFPPPTVQALQLNLRFAFCWGS